LTNLAPRVIFNHMVEYPTTLDHVFGALADPTRRAILARLTRGEALVTQLAQPFPISLNAVSKHVRALERAGLVRRTVVGREHRCALEPTPLCQASHWLEHYRAFWEGRLDALEQFLASRASSRKRTSRRSNG
jgi:DNA-binding transcriptional ArsR family regulator